MNATCIIGQARVQFFYSIFNARVEDLCEFHKIIPQNIHSLSLADVVAIASIPNNTSVESNVFPCVDFVVGFSAVDMKSAVVHEFCDSRPANRT